MRSIDVQVFANELLIGEATISELDGGMAVSGGIFRPNSNYDVHRHAFMSEDFDSNEGICAIAWDVRDRSGVSLGCSAAAIMDFSRLLGPDELKIDVFELDHRTLFHPGEDTIT